MRRGVDFEIEKYYGSKSSSSWIPNWCNTNTPFAMVRKTKRLCQLGKEDLVIREYVAKHLTDASISRVNISRQVDRIEIEFFTARPRALVGAKGEALLKVREALKAKLPAHRSVALYVTKTVQPELDAVCIAENIAMQLEKRAPFRRTIRQALRSAQKAGAVGIKVQIAGRLNGLRLHEANGHVKDVYHYIPFVLILIMPLLVHRLCTDFRY